MRDADMVLTQVTKAVLVVDYASDGDVTFASSIPLAYMSTDGTLSTRWLLDDDATFHVTPCRDWFSTFSSGRLGCV